MEMTFQDYIKKHYDVSARIRARIINPKEIIKNRDDLPYDDILFIDGEFQKAVYIDDDTAISVAELISYTHDDIKKVSNRDLILLYENYMSQINVEDVDIMGLISAAQVFMKDKKNERMRLLGCIQ